jgi:hypothetical protein
MFLSTGEFLEVRVQSTRFYYVKMAFPRISDVSTSAEPSDNISICYNHICIFLNVLPSSLQLHLSCLFFGSRVYDVEQ